MATTPVKGSILVVDDTEDIRVLLKANLEFFGHTVAEAKNGRQALEMMRSQPFDLILLDIMMPGMNGYAVLENMKTDFVLQRIPVIVISAIHDLDSVVRCIELGAVDYLPKPFKTTLLRARIDTLLEQKRLRDQEQEYLIMIEEERAKAEQLLLNILPAPIAERLKAGEKIIADSFPEATVMFADVVDFTAYASNASASDVVSTLNNIFIVFDELVERHGLEKIKTTGDSYMVVGGLPLPRPDHVEAVAELALEMQAEAVKFRRFDGSPVRIRAGMHCGPVVAGVIGKKKFIYDLWGDTVNIASRMEALGLADHIQVSSAVYERLRDRFEFKERGTIEVKGKGEMQTYLLLGSK